MTPRIPEHAAREVACLFATVAQDLHRFACRLTHGDNALAEDLVQEVFKAAALKWDEVRKKDLDRQRAWLFRVLKNKEISNWRTSSRCQITPDIEEPAADPNSTHEKALHAIALDRCWAVIKAMPPNRHRVAYLRWHEAWSTDEIANFLNITPSTVRVHLKNARDELKTAVGPDVVFLETTDLEEAADE